MIDNVEMHMLCITIDTLFNDKEKYMLFRRITNQGVTNQTAGEVTPLSQFSSSVVILVEVATTYSSLELSDNARFN